MITDNILLLPISIIEVSFLVFGIGDRAVYGTGHGTGRETASETSMVRGRAPVSEIPQDASWRAAIT